MTIGVPANIVISSGDACRYGADGKRFDDTLSPEISQHNAARTIRGGDFSTPLRFGRNDERGARQYRHLERGDAPVWVLEGNRFDETLSREISHQKANPVTLTLSSAAKPPQQPSRRRRVKLKNLKNPRAGGPSTFSLTTLLYNPRRQPHPFFNLRRSRHNNPRGQRPRQT